jgi:hypothetical protein
MPRAIVVLQVALLHLSIIAIAVLHHSPLNRGWDIRD